MSLQVDIIDCGLYLQKIPFYHWEISVFTEFVKIPICFITNECCFCFFSFENFCNIRYQFFIYFHSNANITRWNIFYSVIWMSKEKKKRMEIYRIWSKKLDYGSVEIITRPKLEFKFISFINRFAEKDFEYMYVSLLEKLKPLNT